MEGIEDNDENGSRAEGEWNETNGNDALAAQDSSSSENSDSHPIPDINVAANSSAPGDSPFDHAEASEDAAEYDPESLTTTIPVSQNTQQTLKPSPQPVSKKPKTAGGFLVGDSDSEDDASTPGSVVPAAQSLLAQARSPLQIATSVHAEPVNGDKNVGLTSQPTLDASSAIGPTTTLAANVEPPAADPVVAWEAIVKADPRGALDTWLALIAEYRRRNDYPQIRDVYERFLAIFPQSADTWSEYMEYELQSDRIDEAEGLFKRTLTTLQNVRLFTVYLDHIRRRNNLSESSGDARSVISQSFEYVLSSVGIDKLSGTIWSDYIQFLKSGPGQLGDTDWVSLQKMDVLRKTYQRAIAVPISNINALWREYDQFEQLVDKKKARATLAQNSPNYMTAKGANTVLETRLQGVIRHTLPRLPPAPGFEGHEAFLEQVDMWQRWIQWEKSDPIELKDEQPQRLRERIMYVYKQSLMALRFWPEMWVDAAEWCFDSATQIEDRNTKEELNRQGEVFLRQGIEANPESVLLALKQADHAEAALVVGDSESVKSKRAAAIRAPYDQVLDVLYDLAKTLKEQERVEVARMKETAGNGAAVLPTIEEPDGDDNKPKALDGPPTNGGFPMPDLVGMIERAYAARHDILMRTITFVWTALARAMRRVQGKGLPGSATPGLRGVFTEARKRGKITSDFYVAVALMEWKLYKEPACGRIFERGARLFPDDESFMLEYVKWLHSTDDTTNAKVVFETCVNKWEQQPETVPKTRALLTYFHNYLAQWGEQSQIAELEARIARNFPNDPKLNAFKSRFASNGFDPIAAQIIISPAAQLRPKPLLPPPLQRASVMSSPRPSLAVLNSPRLGLTQVTDSPKRPAPPDDFDDRPRKVQRAESPLKGAAGRRLDQQRRQQGGVTTTQAPSSNPIPRDVTFLLGQLPPRSTYNLAQLSADGINRLLQNTTIPDFMTWKNTRDGPNNPANQPSRPAPSTHVRQASSDFHQAYAPPMHNGRPQSPYNGYLNAAPTYTTYKPSPLRPEPAVAYEPPPMAYGQPQAWVPPPQPPAHMMPYSMPTPVPQPMTKPSYGGVWQPPPGAGYAQYGQPPAPPQPPYGGYY